MRIRELYEQIGELVDFGLGEEYIDISGPVISLVENRELLRSRYLLIVQFCTDGDYWLDTGFLKYNDEYGIYAYNEGFSSRDTIEIRDIIIEIKDSIRCERERLLEDLNYMIDTALEELKETGMIDVSLGGNYEGTFIKFIDNPF